MFEITARAVSQIRALMKAEGVESSGLRVSVKPSGCSGLEYVMEFAERAGPSDQAFQSDGLQVFVDAGSAAYLEGIRLDWGEGLLGSGFKFTNPNASKTCGCGKSFSVEPAG